jgi:Domain of unknown function (DUF1905)/Bacteriocin-protection, YdeI or OmpD-Associated
MLKFKATIEYFSNNKDKTGWSFVILSKSQSSKLNPGVRQSFRVKGKVDEYPVKQKALLPVSEGRFMFTLDAKIRRSIKKQAGDKVTVEIELDKAPLKLSEDLVVCLQDEPTALAHFKTLNASHQRYFSNFVKEAKTEATREKRITMCLSALSRKMDFGQMIRENHAKRLSER